MQVGVIDTADHVNSPKIKMLTFPNYSDPAFTEKWKNMGDFVAFPMEELPSEGKENISIQFNSMQVAVITSMC